MRFRIDRPILESLTVETDQRNKIQWIALIGFSGCALLLENPALALFAGLILAILTGLPHEAKGNRITKVLLQVCVVMLGFAMDFGTILRAGRNGAVFSAVSIAATLALGHLLGKWMGIDRGISALISSGTAICGGSAIAAVSSVLPVVEKEMAVAIGTVFVLNGIGLYVFPAIGHLIGLNPHQFGVWSGVAIHDISSVVGTSMSYGGGALQTAMAVKLARTLWIAPVAFGYQIASRRWASKQTPEKSKPQATLRTIPWFIAGFALASVVRSYSPSIALHSDAIASVSRMGFVLVLLLIGASLNPQTLRSLGWRACAQGFILWLFISAGALLAIVICHF